MESKLNYPKYITGTYFGVMVAILDFCDVGVGPLNPAPALILHFFDFFLNIPTIFLKIMRANEVVLLSRLIKLFFIVLHLLKYFFPTKKFLKIVFRIL